ncbi:MAG: dehydrogenase [Planctomycetes bacterium]|nr:dehydrogenase [Planctomycetota bacterium]
MVVAVAGGSGGIGAAVLAALREGGAYAWDLSLEPRPGPTDASFIRTDVCDPDSVDAGLDAVIERSGRLDGLVNATGLTRDRTLMKMTDEEWRDVIDVDLTGAFNLQRAAARRMAETGRGVIVQITSINGLRGRFGQSNYSAAKAGVIGLVRTGARELGRKGIRINAIAPGMILTAMTETLSDSARERACSETALGHLGVPQDVAGPVVFLLSELARHVTGHVLVVDGGQIA